MRCGKGHEHATALEVKECYGVAHLGDAVRMENLVPAGPAPANDRAREIAQKKAIDALNRQKAAAGEIHAFTAHCPQCVAGMHKWQGYKDVFSDELGEGIPPPPEPQRHNGFEARPNRYPGTCLLCGQYVPAEAGLLGDKVDGRFTVRHLPDQCLKKADIDNATEERQTQRGPLPDVPEGHYAIPSLTGNNDLDFFRVDRPTEGSWKGKTYIKRVIGGHPDKNIRFSQYRPVLEAIVKNGINECGQLYGVTIGQCRHCNRHLTDDESRARGSGPDCFAQHGC